MTIRWRRMLLAGVLGAGIISAACNDDDDAGELSGAWERSVLVTADDCDLGALGQTGDSILKVSHLDSALTIDYYDRCGTLNNAGQAGSVSGSVVMVTRSLGHVCSGDPFLIRCCYDIAETDTGTFLGEGIEGETIEVFSLNSSLSHSSCEPLSACTVRGTFTWQRCPPGDCSFRSCP